MTAQGILTLRISLATIYFDSDVLLDLSSMNKSAKPDKGDAITQFLHRLARNENSAMNNLPSICIVYADKNLSIQQRDLYRIVHFSPLLDYQHFSKVKELSLKNIALESTTLALLATALKFNPHLRVVKIVQFKKLPDVRQFLHCIPESSATWLVVNIETVEDLYTLSRSLHHSKLKSLWQCKRTASSILQSDYKARDAWKVAWKHCFARAELLGTFTLKSLYYIYFDNKSSKYVEQFLTS